MPRLVALLVFCLALAPLHAASPVLTLENELLPSPAPVGAHSPVLLRDRNQFVVLFWETATADKPSARQAVFDPASRTWQKFSHNSGPAVLREKNHDGWIFVKNAGRTAKAWFDPVPKDPSIQLAIQPHPHDHFTMPLRVEDGRPSGDPDLVLLADGTVFVSWPEHYNQNETALWLRRVTPGGSRSVPVLLAVFSSGQPAQRLALVKDFDEKPAQLLLAYTVGQCEASQIVTRLLTVAPATDATRRSPCHGCPDPEESARGYALRGQVISFSIEHNTLTAKHGGIDDVLPAGSTEFKVDPSILKDAATGNEFFARIEKRGGDWWLFAAGWVVRPKP